MVQDKSASFPKPEILPTPAAAVPAVDPNSPLKIEQVIKSPAIPKTDINAPLKIESDPHADAASGNEKSGKRLFVLGSLVGLVIIITALGFYYYLVKSNQEASRDLKPSETLQVKEKPKQPFDRLDWSLEILNGSKTPGSAKKAGLVLEGLGYKILKVGNADKNDYRSVQIFVAENRKNQSEAFLADLTGEFKSAVISGVLFDSTASARIIIGEE